MVNTKENPTFGACESRKFISKYAYGCLHGRKLSRRLIILYKQIFLATTINTVLADQSVYCRQQMRETLLSHHTNSKMGPKLTLPSLAKMNVKLRHEKEIIYSFRHGKELPTYCHHTSDDS